MEQTPPEIERAAAVLRECIACSEEWNDSCEQAAGSLARLLVESGMPGKEMLRRLRALGVSGSGAKELVSDARRAKGNSERAREEEQFVGATPLCMHCAQPIGRQDHICPKCGGPVTAYAAIDPIMRIHSAGRAYRHAVSRPNPVALVAMWLIFGPAALFTLFIVNLILRALGAYGPQDPSYRVQSDGLFVDLLKLVMICALMTLYSAMLWKMTARWKRSRREEQ